jgi:nitrilase
VSTVHVAAVQATPVFLDRDATTAKACDLIGDAATAGAQLVVFPEAFIPTYPDWIWRRRPWDDGDSDWFTRLFDQAVVVPSDVTDRLGEAARERGCYVIMGLNERDPHGSTLYNTLVFFAPDGSILGKHRKLMPTGGERLVWGSGDASGLRVYETPLGRIGGLICWENYMPLARAALYGMGVQIYAAPTWDNSDEWVPTLRHIAKEGGCHVIGVTPFLRGSDVPASIPGRDEIYGQAEDRLSRGNTTIVAAGGRIVAGPLVGEEGILHAELESAELTQQKRMFDVAGHYARSDVFQLTVDRRPRQAVTFVSDPHGDPVADETDPRS